MDDAKGQSPPQRDAMPSPARDKPLPPPRVDSVESSEEAVYTSQQTAPRPQQPHQQQQQFQPLSHSQPQPRQPQHRESLSNHLTQGPTPQYIRPSQRAASGQRIVSGQAAATAPINAQVYDLRPRTPEGQQSTSTPNGRPALPEGAASPGGATVQLHPSFPGTGGDGELTVLCTDGSGQTGFCVKASTLGRVSSIFADAIARLPEDRGTLRGVVQVTEHAPEMALLLEALVHGHIGAPRPNRAPLVVTDYLTLLKLYSKYGVRGYLRAMLVHRINERAHELGASLSNPRTARGDFPGLLRLAHLCPSERLWDVALRYAGSWRYWANPWGMSDAEERVLGPGVVDVLVALEALKSGSGEGTITGCKVTYTADGKPCVSRVKEPGVVFQL